MSAMGGSSNGGDGMGILTSCESGFSREIPARDDVQTASHRGRGAPETGWSAIRRSLEPAIQTASRSAPYVMKPSQSAVTSLTQRHSMSSPRDQPEPPSSSCTRTRSKDNGLLLRVESAKSVMTTGLSVHGWAPPARSRGPDERHAVPLPYFDSPRLTTSVGEQPPRSRRRSQDLMHSVCSQVGPRMLDARTSTVWTGEVPARFRAISRRFGVASLGPAGFYRGAKRSMSSAMRAATSSGTSASLAK